MYQLTAALFLRRVAMLSAYGGAYALISTQKREQAATTQAPDYASMALNPDVDNTPDFEVQAKFRKILAETYPESYASGGIKEVSPDKMMEELSN
jgi:hypothetical protein